jgi:hypothetical protein
MPDCNDPYGLSLNTIEKPIGRYDDLTIGEIGKLRNGAPGRRKLLETA